MPDVMKFLAPEEYQPGLQILFSEVANKVRQHLPKVRIEHIGASAIPGAISKGDLDIFVGVEKSDFGSSLATLLELGYHVKEGTLRKPALCMLVCEGYSADVAIQLVELGSEFEVFVTFRNRVREDNALLVQYNQMKRESEGLTPEAYRSRKDELIAKVLA